MKRKLTTQGETSAAHPIVSSGEAAEVAIALSKEENIFWDDAISIVQESGRKNLTAAQPTSPQISEQ